MLAEAPYQVAKVLDTLAPSSREALFNAAYPEQERTHRIFPITLLDVLPHQLRDRKRHECLPCAKSGKTGEER